MEHFYIQNTFQIIFRTKPPLSLQSGQIGAWINYQAGLCKSKGKTPPTILIVVGQNLGIRKTESFHSKTPS